MNVTATRGGGDIPSTDTQEFLHQAILIIDGAFVRGMPRKIQFSFLLFLVLVVVKSGRYE